jgi:hypothetical protein
MEIGAGMGALEGNTHLTLAEIIERTVAEGIATGRIEDVPWPPGWEPL